MTHPAPTAHPLRSTMQDAAPSFVRRALYEDVADRLRQQIFARELEPGTWIDEQRMALDFGISRTPLREALKVLATEGLITMKVRRGAYVTEMSEQDVNEVYHLMALLECDAVGELAKSATKDQLQLLQQTHLLLEAAIDDRTQFFALNEVFHMQLLEFAGNRWRRQIVSDLRKVMKLNRHLSLFKQGRLAESLSEHRALMQALVSRNQEQAIGLMQQHFAKGLSAATVSK